MPFFKNRRYRIYFELLDSFRREGCPLCDLLSRREQQATSTLIHHVCRENKKQISLLELCHHHRIRTREALNDPLPAVGPLKKAVAEKIGEMMGYSAPRSIWRRWLWKSFYRCPLCRQLEREERDLCRTLISLLDDVDFWKGLQCGPLLCLDHLEKCLATGSRENGLVRLLQDQTATLNELMDDLLRLEATGKGEEFRDRALEWLADSKGIVLNARKAEPDPDPNEPDIDLFSDPTSIIPLDADNQAAEALVFEIEKLKRRIQNLTDMLNKAESRAASLHFRAAELSEDNKILEMKYTGAHAMAQGLENTVGDLREEIKRLKGKEPADLPKRTA